MSDEKKYQPMDATIREEKEGVVATNHKRVAYALSTLVKEVLALFPETPHEFSGIDGRNTALDVTFDLTNMIPEDRDYFVPLLHFTEGDGRVSDVSYADDMLLVQIRPGARTQDVRDTFGLADAWLILTGTDESDTDGGDAWDTSDDKMEGGGA